MNFSFWFFSPTWCSPRTRDQGRSYTWEVAFSFCSVPWNGWMLRGSDRRTFCQVGYLMAASVVLEMVKCSKHSGTLDSSWLTFSVLEPVGHQVSGELQEGNLCLIMFTLHFTVREKKYDFFYIFPHPIVNKESENHLTLPALVCFHNCNCKNIYNTTWLQW